MKLSLRKEVKSTVCYDTRSGIIYVDFLNGFFTIEHRLYGWSVIRYDLSQCGGYEQTYNWFIGQD